MTKMELSSFLVSLASYFERRVPTAATVEQWFKAIESVPGEALPAIESQLRNNETFPRNFPGAVWACYRAWQEAHPEKVAHKRKFQCPAGCDYGLLYVRKAKAPKANGGRSLEYDYVFACSTCNQGPIGYPHAAMKELLAQGYEPAVQRKHGAAYYKKQSGVKGIVSELSRKMEMPVAEQRTISVENSHNQGQVEKMGGEMINEPSDEELLNVGAIK